MKARRASLLLAAPLVACGLSACGEEPPPADHSCGVVIDHSSSSEAAGLGELMPKQVSEFAEESTCDTMVVRPVTANSQAACVVPTLPLRPEFENDLQFEQYLADARANAGIDVREALERCGPPEDGASDVVGAIVAIAELVHGDRARILVVSDMIQTARPLNLTTTALDTDDQRAAAVAVLEDKLLLPDLDRAEVRMFGAGTGSDLPPDRITDLVAFWRLYFEQAGGAVQDAAS
jgi:hypothetical protein